jgi:hypothetical protein
MEIAGTIEARWFLDDIDGPVAAAARRWFDGVADEGKREDRYLLLARDDVGFKARIEEGRPTRIETKLRLGSLGPSELYGSVVGNVEQWEKLSLEANDAALERDGRWIRLAKRRQLRRYRVDHHRVVAVADTTERLAAGCAVELTELAWTTGVGFAPGRSITIGLEAFGPETERLDVLLRTCAAAFASAPPDLRLEAASSESYPSWLRRFRGH